MKDSKFIPLFNLYYIYHKTDLMRIIFAEVELESIQDRYVQVLRSYLEHAAPHHPGRLQELFARIPEVILRVV